VTTRAQRAPNLHNRPIAMNALRNLALFSLTLLLSACGSLNFYSDEELEPLSKEAYEEATKETGGRITSGRDYEMVQRVAKKIAAACEEDFPWEARLLRADNIPNAFCLPNGRIAIYTGILPITQNEDGLAIVMGHEVAHAVLRHGGKRMTQGMLTQAAMTAVDAGMGVAQMADTTRGNVMAVLGAGANVGILLPFSRDHESEADIEGLRYAIRAGYNPEEAPLLWERMAKLAGGEGTPTWLSTHPASADRAAKLREMTPVIREQEKNWQPKPKAPAAGAQAPTKSVDPGAVRR
jgi:predicted Zn-dependent protease